MSLLKPAHFGTLNAEDLDKREQELQNKNTIANEKKSERIFKEYLTSLGLENVDFYHYTKAELDHYL